MTAEQLLGVLALLGDLRNQLVQVTAERDRLLIEAQEHEATRRGSDG